MLLATVTTTSQNLSDILTTAQKEVARETEQHWLHRILIQNKWSVSVYIDFWLASTVSWWIDIAVNDSFSYQDINLADCHLISEWSDNSNVRIIIN